jgi:NAD(P)-dependent dehydrogenase (short-subunit alcohol dehydrogenase family)
MKIESSVALVTGANRGIGLALAKALLARGAKKVYAAARDPRSVTLAGVTPLRLDVTDLDQIVAAAREASDVTLVINNAGIGSATALLGDTGEAVLRRELETNAFGLLRVSRAFAPVLAANGGGGLVNLLSVVSWINSPVLATYSVSKSAAWSISNGLRNELRAQGTQVVGVHVGYVDTDLTKGLTGDKHDANEVAASILTGVAAGHEEVVVDELSRQVKLGVAMEPSLYLQPPRRS